MKNAKQFTLALITFFLIGMTAMLTGCSTATDSGGGGGGQTSGSNIVTFNTNQDGGTLTVQLGPVTISTGTKVPEGTKLTVIAAPQSGNKFEKFTIDGTDYTGNTTITYTMPAWSVDIAAVFSQIDVNEFIITLVANPAAGGYFTDAVSDTPITTITGKKNFPSVFNVVTDPAYELVDVKWQPTAGGSETTIPQSGGSYTITRPSTGDITITAYFNKLPAKSDITLTAIPSTYGQITADTDPQSVTEGAAVNITATPAAGGVYGFNRFQVNNIDVVPENVTDNGDGSYTYTLTMPDTSVEVKAYFGINVTINYYEGNVVNQAIMEGQAFARPSPDPLRGLHTFVGWYDAADGGSPVDFPLTITAPVTIYAHWTLMDLNRDDYTIYVNDLTPYTDGYNLRINYQQWQGNAAASGSRIMIFIDPRDVATSASKRVFEINPWGGGPKTDVFYSYLAPLPAGVTAADILPSDVVGSTGYRGDSYSVQQFLAGNGYAGPDPDKPRNEILDSDLDNVMVLDLMNTPAWGGGWNYLGSGVRDHEVNGVTIIRVETWVPNN